MDRTPSIFYDRVHRAHILVLVQILLEPLSIHSIDPFNFQFLVAIENYANLLLQHIIIIQLTDIYIRNDLSLNRLEHPFTFQNVDETVLANLHLAAFLQLFYFAFSEDHVVDIGRELVDELFQYLIFFNTSFQTEFGLNQLIFLDILNNNEI